VRGFRTCTTKRLSNLNPCIAGDCINKVIAKGLCQRHYDKRRRFGTLELRPDILVCVGCDKEFDVPKCGTVPDSCKPCQKEAARIRVRKDRWRKGLKEGYNMTPDDYYRMYENQNGVCKICSLPETKGRGAKNKRLAVDHNHKTGKVRGLLCGNCNTGIGLLKDDAKILALAVKYLEESERENNATI